MSLTERLSNLLQDTQQQTNDRARFKLPGWAHFNHAQELALSPDILTEPGGMPWAAGVMGPNEGCVDVLTLHWLSGGGVAGLFPLGERTLKSLVLVPITRKLFNKNHPIYLKNIFTWL